MERIIDTRTINIEIKSISNSDKEGFVPIDKLNIIISSNGEEIVNATVDSSIYYKTTNPLIELEKCLLGIQKTNAT